jgi:hypothetical protein
LLFTPFVPLEVFDLRKSFENDFADCSLFDFRKGSSLEDVTALEFVGKSVRLKDGQFCVRIPWKENPKNLPSAKQVALSRLYALQKRFVQDPILHESYSKEMQKFIDKDYVEVRAADNPDSDLFHYIPHYPV